jgi:glutathione S-transferase
MLTIYGDSISGNCHKVKWTADYLGVAYDWIETDILAGATRTEAYLALNPAGQVPLVLLPDGRPLAQSNAIIVHLAEASDLIPVDAYHRAKMFEWLFWEQYSHEPYVAVARFQVKYLGKAFSDLEPKLIARAHAALARLEQAAEASAFLIGERCTLADVSLIAYTRLAPEGGLDLAAYPGIRAWIGRTEAALGIG